MNKGTKLAKDAIAEAKVIRATDLHTAITPFNSSTFQFSLK